MSPHWYFRRRWFRRDWWLAPVPRIYVAVLFMLFMGVCVGLGVVIATNHNQSNKTARLAHRLVTDEQNTCLIQARGLPAGHELSAIIGGLYQVLTLPPVTQAQKQQRAQIPKFELKILANLTTHLHNYTRIEKTQPHTRVCGPTKKKKRKRLVRK